MINPFENTSFLEFLPTMIVYDHTVKNYVNFEPRIYQQTFAQELESDHMRIIHCAARQMGSSTMLSAFAIWTVLTCHNHEVIILSERYRTSTQLIQKIRNSCDLLSSTTIGPNIYISLTNSSIIADTINKNSLRGMALKNKTIIIDNAAYICCM
jgi:hypothetical protein